MASVASTPLLTISPDGEVPKCRMVDAMATMDFGRRLINNDSDKRAAKRARVNGLVDGNPPYSRSALLRANRAEACNVNWGVGRAYMESGVGAFYDLASEAPGFFGIRTSFGSEEQREVWSMVLREEADRILSQDEVWDYELQQSQNNMVMHGCGPLMFQDTYQVLPRAVSCGNLLVPEFTRSDVKYWEAAVCRIDYYPPELYEFIQNREAATKMGWNVDFTRKVIENAMNIQMQQGVLYDWEFYQQQLKNNSLTYYDDSKVCRMLYTFWKEFDGKITHAIVQESTNTPTPVEYSFIKIGRYDNWQQVVHPMYFDRGNGGYHHSVTGLGVKMYSAMEYQNRLLCNLADKAFAPKILFKPTTTEATQKFSMQNMGDFAVLNSNWEWSQTGVAGLMNEGLAMNKTVTELMESNLSSYRQQMPVQEGGNPPTKYQKQLEASQQSSLSKTTFNRYYKQMDQLYTEIVRRLCNLNTTDDRAKEFQERCLKKGVAKECFGRIEKVEAIRVIGQGNAFMRKQSVSEMGAIVERLPEEGQNNWLNDFIASSAGATAVGRYNPPKLRSRLATDQQAEAMQWVAAMKVGMSPVVTSSQNAVTYAATYLKAASDAAQSLQQGANPQEVLQFLMVAGPAIAAQIQRFSKDPMRQDLVKTMTDQWKQLAGIADQLKAKLEQQAQQQQQSQQQTQQAMTDEQIKSAKAQGDIAIKTAKTKAQLQQSAEKHQQKMVQGKQNMILADAQTAAEIQRNRLKAEAEAENKSSEE